MGELKCPQKVVQRVSVGIQNRGGLRWTEMKPEEVEFKLILEMKR